MSEIVTSIELLTQQLEQLKQLDAILIQENEVLQQHIPDALDKITEQKNTLLLSIQSLDEVIGNSPTFANDKESEPCQALLKSIEETLLSCKHQNTVNGRVIQHSQLAVERMKTSLLDSQNKSAVTYDSKGKKSGGLSSIGLKA